MREQPIGEAVEDDERAKVIAYHRGDAHAAIDTLLEDIRHLCRQLALTEGAMNRGMARGWRPSYHRD
ncbi:hypothetical protein ELI54_30565 (plasmid) [Rhizobium ruizarguesonis]|uniref:hypothetical protein n=1 Tax=Rhizobium ruizarguesonis TaxID=2081791 RepID=UPI001031F297|nr:hypothetical protein [Rhizobium ruizarguesonis]TAT72231.1 hypothetical protein ELI56_31775 [Rhizobium ruizarguesonis]TAT75875.1 hypothetical protein ELI54_30565 [Rhizobium ruizarguesonis]TAZ67663.1 hypothetical protein ELH70_29130 [Rhizobium ruizarguesonis]TAZ89130.1 hypothetical protein ELH69_34365 [Rhizobium ruizarguesonis]TBB80041.1 hypothetical protein ELH41_32120 [Rhizobium ruizarguesonis]